MKCSFSCSNTSRLESLIFLGLRRAIREAANLSFLKVSERFVISFCAASVALLYILTCFETCRESSCVTKRNTFASFRVLSKKMSGSFRGRCSTLETSIILLHGRRSTSESYLSRCVLSTPRSTLHMLHFTLYILHSTRHTPQSTRHSQHSTLDTSHFKL